MKTTVSAVFVLSRMALTGCCLVDSFTNTETESLQSGLIMESEQPPKDSAVAPLPTLTDQNTVEKGLETVLDRALKRKRHNEEYDLLVSKHSHALNLLTRECVASGIYMECDVCSVVCTDWTSKKMPYCIHKASLCNECAKECLKTSIHASWFRCPRCRQPSAEVYDCSFDDIEEIDCYFSCIDEKQWPCVVALKRPIVFGYELK